MEFECRTCLKVSTDVHNIFSNDLPHKIETITSLEVIDDEKFSSKICEECVRNVNTMYEFCQVVRSSNVIVMTRGIKQEAVTVTETYQNEEMEFKQELYLDDDNEIATPELGSKKTELFMCILCDFTSPEYDLWDFHQEQHKAICSICGKSVLSYSLKKHYLSHINSQVKCLICNKMYKHEESLRAHMSTMHKRYGGPYLCTICGKVYRHRQGFYSHKKRHTSGDTKMVECSTCGKLFFDKKALVNHIYSHTGERPFACRYCDRGFSNSYARNIHENSACIHFYFSSPN